MPLYPGVSGDVVGPASSVEKEVALFDGTTGKLLERATGSGIARVTSGVWGTPGNVALASEVSGVLPVANGGSRVVQIVNTQTGAMATGSGTIPADNSIPQSGEGDEYMTLAITPTASANKLKIDVVFNGTNATSARDLCVALFQDSTADALACAEQGIQTGAYVQQITFTHVMTAGTTSATTFKVRAGVGVSGTTTFNGTGGAARYGGVFASSITITEYVP